jgi:hypothetical protein
LNDAIKQGWQLGKDPSFWEKAKQGAQSYLGESYLPAEKGLRAILPKEEVKTPPQMIAGPRGLGVRQIDPNDREQAIGSLLGAARTIEQGSQRGTAALGAGAGLMSAAGLPGMVTGGAFSLDMLWNAYKNWKASRQDDPNALPREAMAGKTSAISQAILAFMPWLKMGKEAMSIRKPSPVKASVPGLPPPVPKAAETTLQPPPPMAVPSPAVRPGPVQANPVEAVAVSKTPYNPEADPWYQKAVQDIADQETSKRGYQEALAARRTPPGGWVNTPESLQAEAAARQTAPVGGLALAGEAEQAGPLPAMRKPYEQIVAEFAQSEAERKLEQMKTDFLSGTGGMSGKGRSLDTSAMNAQAMQNLTQHDTGFGRVNVQNAYQDILQGYGANPKRIAEALQRKSPRANSVYNDLLSRAKKLALEDPDLKESARKRFLEQFSEYDDSPEAIAAFEKHGSLTGEEGFARIKDERSLGPRVKPEDFSYGFIGKEGQPYQIHGDHQVEMAKAMGQNPRKYHLLNFVNDMADSELVRARRSPRDMEVQAFAPVTPGQRGTIASLANKVEPYNFRWETPKKLNPGQTPWGFGLGEFLRAVDTENLPVAPEAKTTDNPLVKVADELTKITKKK